MFKYRFRNFPTTDDYGHFSFLDDYLSVKENIFMSDGLIENSDKFDNKALYTIVREHEINKIIVDRKVSYPKESYFAIPKLEIVNAGVNYTTKNTKVEVFLFDSFSYDGGSGRDPMTRTYKDLKKEIPKESRI